MTLLSKLLAIASVIGFFALIMYIVFGQVTVRRLRKNPTTKDALGFEYVSGWDIVNAAQALALPKAFINKLKNGPLSALYANADLLHKHTNKVDRFLGAAFYWLMMISGLSFCFLALFDVLGFFD